MTGSHDRAFLPQPERVTRPERWWRDVLDHVVGMLQASIAASEETRAPAWLSRLRDGDTQEVERSIRRALGAVGEAPPSKVIEVCEGELAAGRDVWFIGDVHGDLLGLETALQVVKELSGPRPIVVLLGDLIDDGVHCGEVVLRVFELVLRAPDLATVVVAGNHDEALRYDMDRAAFASCVHPGDFAPWLNDHAAWHDVGRAYVNFVTCLPRALFFRGGVFAAHAGFPHSDTWARITESSGVAGLQEPSMLQDFAWNRLAESRRKIPSRGSLGCSFGSEDFAGFCAVASKALGHDIEMMVRGHDHVSDRAERYSRPLEGRHWSYGGRVLTINNLCHVLPREAGLDFGRIGFHRHPTIARWRAGLGAPIPVVLEVPGWVIDEYVETYAAREHLVALVEEEPRAEPADPSDPGGSANAP